jgi:hypothetical protein
MFHISTTHCELYNRDVDTLHGAFTDLWKENQGQKLNLAQHLKLQEKIKNHLPKNTNQEIQQKCSRSLVNAVWYAFRPIEQCLTQQSDKGRYAILNSALFIDKLRFDWELLTENEKKESANFIFEKQVFIPRSKECGNGTLVIPFSLRTEHHAIAYDNKINATPFEMRYSEHMFSLLLGLIPADKHNKRIFHNAVVRLLLECWDLSKIGLTDPCFYDVRSLHKLIEHCRIIYLQAKEKQVVTGYFAAEEIVKTPLFEALLHHQSDSSISATVAKEAQQWAMGFFEEYGEQIQKLLQNTIVQHWLHYGYYAHTLPAVLTLHGLDEDDKSHLDSCLSFTNIRHTGSFDEKKNAREPLTYEVCTFDKESNKVQKSEHIVYDVNGIKPNDSLSWYHFFVQTMLGELPFDKWSFHNSMIALLMDLNDIEHSHGLNDAIFFNSQTLEQCIEECRVRYIAIREQHQPLQELLKTKLFDAMIKSDIKGLDVGMRHFIDVLCIPRAIKAVVGQCSDDQRRKEIISLLENQEILDWLRLATYAKTLPSVIAYNYLAVKGLSDRQIEEFSKKRLAITSLWYDKFTKNKLSLIEVKKILKSLQQHANSLALSWSSHTEYEVCDLKIQTDKLFAKVEKMLASSQLDPTVPEELSPEVKEIIAKSIDLTKDPLYATSLQQVCCLLSMVSNLYTFIAKLESRQVLQQTPLFQLAVVYNNGKQDFK